MTRCTEFRSRTTTARIEIRSVGWRGGADCDRLRLVVFPGIQKDISSMTVADSATGSIRVLLFARYADLLGLQTASLPFEAAGSVGAVIRYLRDLPGGQHLPATPLVAVNHRQVRGDHRLAPGDEVALLPPMAGG